MQYNLNKSAAFFVALFIILFPINTLSAQDTQPQFRSELSGSFALGAQVYNSNFLFQPGYAVNYAHSYKLNKHLNIGLGASYMQLDDENFVPLYANLLALKSKGDKDNYFRCNLGYAIANSKVVNQMDDYELNGGLFVKFGVGRTFPISPAVALSTEFSYTYQNARLKNQGYQGRSYTESLDYSFFQLSVGFVFNYASYGN